jgi:hypothetical protein
MITVIGFVGHGNDETTEQFQCRYFELHTSVYDSPKTGHTDFTLNCYFTNGRRWAKVRLPPSGSFVAVTAKIAGRTASDNRLAVRVLDMSYLPKSTSTSTSTPTLTPGSSKKQVDRWSRNAESSTPSKRIRRSSPKNSPSSEVQHPQTPHMSENELDQQLSTTLEEGSDVNNRHMSSTRSNPSQPAEHSQQNRRKRKQ